jgi:hypothetical protein
MGLGSGNRDPGVKKAPGPGSATLYPRFATEEKNQKPLLLAPPKLIPTFICLNPSIKYTVDYRLQKKLKVV